MPPFSAGTRTPEQAIEEYRRSGAANPGPFDGTAGFIFGLARGFVLVCLLYLFYGWVAQPENGKDPEWIAHSAFLPLIKDTNAQFLALVSDAEAKIPQNPEAGLPPRVDRKTADRSIERDRARDVERDQASGYSNGSRNDLDRLLSSQ